MAANLSGMLAQLSKAQGENPFARATDQGISGMAARPQDSVNPMITQAFQGLGGAFGADTAPMQTSNQAYRGAMDAMSSLDLSTAEGLTQAAQMYQKLGMQDKAMAMLQQADVKKKAKAAKDNALLDAKNLEVQETAAKTKRRQQKQMAISIAGRKGDKDAIAALRTDAIEPSAYLMEQTKAGKPTVVGDGAMLVGPDGTILAENTKDFAPESGGAGGVWGGDLSATMQKRLNEAGDSFRQKQEMGMEYDAMLRQMDSMDLSAGWEQSAQSFFNKATGRRDEDDYFRTQFTKLKNFEAIGTLPPGPASDKDIQIVQSGFPDDNAGPEEIKQFLETMARVSKDAATYEQFKSDWISNYGDERGFVSAWKKKADQIASTRWKEATPEHAVEQLMENPEQRDWFLKTFKWLPEGM